jgi:hypothetical protein
MKKIISWILGIGFVIIFSVMLVAFMRGARKEDSEVMAQQIQKIHAIFSGINEECGIISFDRDHAAIDFLNTIKFSGSQVGPMNLAHPERWQGPYVERTMEIQDKPYQIVKTKKGYVILPGDGVRLYNKKVIGMTLKINFDTDITELVHDKNFLAAVSDKPLAMIIPVLNDEVKEHVFALGEALENNY